MCLQVLRVFLGALAIVAIAACGTALAAEEQVPWTSSITGIVTSESTGQPLSNASVAIDDGPLVATSDAGGRFLLSGLAPGTYRLLISHGCCVSRYRTDVLVTANRETYVAVALVALPTRSETVQVTASAFAKPVDVASSWYSSNHEELRRAP